jgi:hypothetical protein
VPDQTLRGPRVQARASPASIYRPFTDVNMTFVIQLTENNAWPDGRDNLGRVSKAVLPLRRRNCESIKKKVDYTVIHDESSSHRGRAVGRSAITN